MARRAAAKDRHVCRFRASFWMVPQVCCMVFSSASTVWRQLFLGHPLLHFPLGVQWRAVRMTLSCSLLVQCPIHLYRLRMMMVSMLSWLQRASNCWWEMVSGQKRFFVSKTDSMVYSSLSSSSIQSHKVGWTSHSFDRSWAWSCCCPERTSTRCWAFWRRLWHCWDGSWFHSLFLQSCLTVLRR